MTGPKFQISFLIIIFWLSLGSTRAQQIGISPININDQLPSQTVNCIFDDREGYTWFGTSEGISKYDGYRITTFKPDSRQTDINSENVLSINETETDILIGTEKGLFLLDKRTHKTSLFPDKGIKDRKINRILIDKKSRIWVGTEAPLYVYNQDFSIQKSFQHNPKDKTSIPKGAVNSIFEDADGNIWVCFWVGGLYRFDEKSNRLVAYPKIGAQNNPFKIFQDNKKQLWICTWNDGLYQFKPEGGKDMYQEIVIQNKRSPQEKEPILYDIVQDDVQNYIWVLSYSGVSALKYLPDGSVQETDLAYLFENTSNIFNNIYKDKRGGLWISMVGEGVSIINFNKPEIKNYKLSAIKDRYRISPNPTMLFEDADGKIWFNQSNIGLGLFDPRHNQISMYIDNPKLKNDLSLGSVSCAAAVNEEIWIGSTHEAIINVFNREKGMDLKRAINLRQFVSNIGNPLSFSKDIENNLWIATTNGVLKKPFDRDTFELVQIPPDHINGITQDTQGNIWIGTRNNGIYKIQSGKSAEITRFGKNTKNLGTNNIEALDADDNGNLWIGTKDNRLVLGNISQTTFQEFINPFLLSNSQILDVIYHDNHVWISTPQKIFRINPHSKSVFEYSGEDGLNVNMLLKGAYFANKKTGEISFGGNKGIFVLKASSIPPADGHKVVISGIKINNKSLITDDIDRVYDFQALQLTLNPDDQNIEIDFSALEYRHPQKIRYAYKLEGIDKDWIYPPGDRTFATYNNLSKGNYKFLIRSTDLSKKWRDEITELTIYKKPAFYESRLAYLIYLLAIGGLTYYIIQFSIYRLKLRNDLKIAKIEKEKADELIQTKLRYFTNISHDLLTPLTIISCLIDDVEITNKKHLPQFEKMRFNLNRLKRLLQQILDFRKVESGNMELKISKGNIVRFIEEICTTYFSPLAKKKNINFNISHTSNESNAYFDADKIDKILFNLLSNAFKYTPDGGSINVELDINRSAEHSYLSIQISDTGIGISPEEIDKIFIQFYNHKNANKNESNGIGLALTKDLVKIHYGSITVQSEISKGTCFNTRIPIDRNSYSEIELKNANEIIFDDHVSLEIRTLEDDIVSESKTADQERLHLLLVEDNEDLLVTVKSILSKNYHVITASNGKRALDLIKDNEIDIIISDVMMPELDGLELCRILKSNVENSHIPIILLTAKNSVNDRVDCYNAGADAYISKPFDLKVLEARIHNFVTHKRTKQIGFKTSPEINISKLDYPTLDEQFLDNAIKIIEEHLTDSDFEVVSFANKLNMSKSTLYRKIKILLGLSPSELIKNIRLKHACQIMEKDKSISVTEVAFATGFSDPRYFATCFKAEFGVTPSEYQKRDSVRQN